MSLSRNALYEAADNCLNSPGSLRTVINLKSGPESRLMTSLARSVLRCKTQSCNHLPHGIMGRVGRKLGEICRISRCV